MVITDWNYHGFMRQCFNLISSQYPTLRAYSDRKGMGTGQESQRGIWKQWNPHRVEGKTPGPIPRLGPE